MRLGVFALLVLLISIWVIACNQADAKHAGSISSQLTTTKAPPAVEGAWKLVWASYNNTLVDMSNHILVKMFTKGSFSLFAHDSTGKMMYTGYRKYGFEGDRYHENFLYHNNRRNWGGMDWQDLQVKGDIMYLNGFTKMIIDGREVTNYPKIKEKLVQVKWQAF